MNTFIKSEIMNNSVILGSFIKELNKFLPCTLAQLIVKAHELSPDLKSFCSANELNTKGRDKGLIGKKVEFNIFGRLPNNDANPDTILGDIKATHIKSCNSGFNAKERLTLTNCGSTNDYDSFQHIIDATTLEQSPRYKKIQTGILCVLEHDKDITNDLHTIVRFLFRYDIDELPTEVRSVLDVDYQKIRTCVLNKAVSQSGQTYLHIHPHGAGHGSGTRAFGFTNKFVTTLISHYCKATLIQKGNSLYLAAP
jgi:hypothetical protein